MSNTNDYNKLNALTYEIIQFLLIFYPKLIFNPWIKRTLEWCRVDWVEFRTQIVMTEVDKQLEDIYDLWEEEEYAKYLNSFYTEEEPDGSEAQNLLGGAMRRTSWWHDKHEPFDPPS